MGASYCILYDLQDCNLILSQCETSHYLMTHANLNSLTGYICFVCF